MNPLAICTVALGFLCFTSAYAATEDCSWVLFKITVNNQGDQLERLGQFDTMYQCFEEWEQVEDTLPKPKTDVQIICISVTEGMLLN